MFASCVFTFYVVFFFQADHEGQNAFNEEASFVREMVPGGCSSRNTSMLFALYADATSSTVSASRRRKTARTDRPTSLFALSLPALFEKQWVSLVAAEEES